MLIQNQFEIEDGVLIAYLGEKPEVQIPEGVHTIGDGAFKGMSWLLSVNLPVTLKKIGAMAFKGCRRIAKLSFPDGLQEIGEYAFHRCHDLEELVFPESMTKVESCAFLYCDGLKKVVMEGPKNLGKAAFSHDIMLREISLNAELDDSNFNDEVFEGCVHIRRITLSGRLYEIDNLIGAMKSDSRHPKLIQSIAKSVYHSMQIEDGVLSNFSINLKNIFLPEGITAIGKGCFCDKKGIASITLPKSVQEIRANAFLNCVSLEEITIQNENTVLDEKAFRGCCNLKRVIFQDKNYNLEDEVADSLVSLIRDQVMGDFYISGRILVRYLGTEEQIRIPKEVEIIGERCFFGNERLRTVSCPEGILEIREQAFAGCSALQSIALSDNLRRVEREAFAECKKLMKCNLPASLEYIGEYAFRRCFSLKPFEPWPENAQIHPYAFYKADGFNLTIDKTSKEYTDCDKTEATKVFEETDGKLRDYEIEGGYLRLSIPNNGTMIAPYSFTKKEGIKILNLTGIKRIGKYAFASCPDLEEVEIDSSDSVIEQNAFAACPKLRSVRLNIKELGKAAFSFCRKLENVSLSGVSVLPAECFAGCSSLREFKAKDISRMEARCFDECVNLDSFDFSGIKLIGERAFERCDSLKSVLLDEVECGFHAFCDCAGLMSVYLTRNTILKSGVFTGCTQLHTVVYDSENFEFSRFSDSLNHTNNPYPAAVREVIASVYSCFDIRERKSLVGCSSDAAAITLPNDIEEIGQDVFRDHVRLTEISIPETLKYFGSHAFTATGWLEEQKKKSKTVVVNGVLLDGTMCKGKIVISGKIKRVASWCFAGNTEITEIEITSEKTIIENLAFRNCLNLKKITDWEGRSFVLNEVADLSVNVFPELIQRIFTESINCFKLDENGNLVESTGNIPNLTFPRGIKTIGDGVYKDCHLLESIELSDTTEKIGKAAFENSKWLRIVTRAEHVKEIASMAFSGCQSLESIDLSDELKELGNRCFEHCCSLREVHLSKQLEVIPERAFFRCKSLKKVIVPESVKVIEKEAFAFCDCLEEVQVPEETVISEGAFKFCNAKLVKI